MSRDRRNGFTSGAPVARIAENDVCGLRNRGICARSPLTSFRVTNLPRGCELFDPIYDIRTRVRRTCIMPTCCFSFSSVFRLFPFPPFFSLAFYRRFHVKHLSVIVRLDERPIDNRNTILPRCVLDIDAGIHRFFPVWKYSFAQISESVFRCGDIFFLIILLQFISCISTFTWFLLFCLVGSYMRLFVCVLSIR